MKRVGNLFEQITSWPNLWLAAYKARRGKRARPNVEWFEFHREWELLRLQRELTAGSYTPAGYRTFVIYEPKRRLISAAPYRDRVVHHAVCNVLEPLFERGVRATGSGVVFGQRSTTWRAACPKTTPDPFRAGATLIHLPVLTGIAWSIMRCATCWNLCSNAE